MSVRCGSVWSLRKGRRVPLSAREFELLRYLIAHRNEVVSREQLLRDVWGYHQLSITRTVDNYVAKLRTQLEAAARTSRGTSSRCTAAAISSSFDTSKTNRRQLQTSFYEPAHASGVKASVCRA